MSYIDNEGFIEECKKQTKAKAERKAKEPKPRPPRNELEALVMDWPKKKAPLDHTLADLMAMDMADVFPVFEKTEEYLTTLTADDRETFFIKFLACFCCLKAEDHNRKLRERKKGG